MGVSYKKKTTVSEQGSFRRGLRERPSARAMALALGLAALAVIPHKAKAGNLVWTPSGSMSSPGGDGVWDTTNSFWSNGTTLAPWSNLTGSSATFGGPAGTVTIDAGGITVQDITFETGGYVLDGGPLTLTAGTSSLITTSAGNVDTINSAIGGSSALVIGGGGTLVLGGVNAYTGGTSIIDNSTLSVTSDANLGAAGKALTLATATSGGTLMIADAGTGAFSSARGITVNSFGGAIDVASGVTATLSGVIGGSGPLTFSNTGTTILTGANTLSGGIIIDAGTLQVGDGTTTGTLGNGNVTNSSALIFNHSNSYTYAGVISGTGTVEQAGSGTTVLTGNSTYTGLTTISGGTLQIGNNGSSGAIVGDIVDNGILFFSRSDSYAYAGTISGTGSVRKNNGGTLTLGGTNTYTGGTYIYGGQVNVSRDANLGDASGTIYINGGTLNSTANVTTERAITIGSGGGALSGGTLTANGVISGSGRLNIYNGTVTLGGVNTYSGGTYVSNNGTLVISSADNLGSGTVTLDSGPYITATLRVTGTTTLTQNIVSTGNYGPNTVAITGGNVLTIDSVVSGGFNLTFSGGGRVVLNGNNTVSGLVVTGGTTIQAASNANLGGGGLTLGGGALETTASFTTSKGLNLSGGGGSLVVDSGTTLTWAGGVSGSGSPLTKSGAGTLVLAANNSYNQGTIINSGVLQVGNGGASGTLGTGNVTNNSALVFDRSDSYSYAGGISGTGTLEQAGSGTTILTGNNSYKGTTTVSGGTLYVNGNQSSATGATYVMSGGTLGGKGTIGGDVTVADGGVFAPGDVGLPSTLTINGNLSLSSGSVLNYRFGQADTVGGALNDLAVVKGDLTLDGTINVTVPDGGAFDPGVYRVFNYTGALTDNGLALGTIPAGNNVTVQTSVNGQVNLVNSLTNVSFWDGGNTGLFNNGAVNGGDGVWNSGTGANSNWTDIDGAANGAYPNGTFAIFEAAPGTVTVDNSGDQVVASGMQFAVDGYLITGGAITLVDKSGPDCVTTTTCTSTVRVGDGTAAGSGYTATIASVLQGDTRLVKADIGTLILTGDNTYNEGTTVAAGTLQLGDGGTSGSVQGDILDNANLAVNRSDTYIIDGNISGTGTLKQIGTGTTVLTGGNSYSGTTTISNGVLQIGNGGTTGTLGGGSVVDNARLVFNRSNNYIYGGNISGTGMLEQAGTGTTILTGNATHTGGTLISAGTLQIGNGQNYGTISGSIVDNGNLAFNRSDTYTFGGTISGTGSVSQIGASGGSRTVLTGINTYTGGTRINAGTLQVSSDANLGDAAGSITLTGGTLDTTNGFATSRNIIVNGTSNLNVNGGHTLTLGGTISGSQRLYLHSGNFHLTGTSTNSELYVADNARLIVDSTSALAGTGQITFGGPPSTYNPGGTLQTTADLTINSNVSAVWTNGGSSTALTFLTDAGTTLTLNGNLYTGGTSSTQIVKTGTGTLIENSNSVGAVYSKILQGTVQIGDGGTRGGWGGGSTAISAGAVLSVNRSNVYTLDTVASGAGEFRQIGTGTTILNKNHSYTGGTTISAGTLQIGAGGTVGSVTGNIADDSHLVFNRSDTYTFGGKISGTGTVQQAGSGTLVLTGANTYAGGTDIKAGILQISSDANLGDVAGPLSFSGGTLATIADIEMTRAAILNGTGKFDVATNTTLTMDGPISGAGGLTKTDFGTLVLNGTNTYTGATNVSAGALYINGDQSAATGATNVASGAMLGGTGIIGGNVTIADGATLAPGAVDGRGTLTINGNLTVGNNSNLNYQFGQIGGVAANSLTNVNGNLTVGGRLNVTSPAGGTFDPGVYRVFNYTGTLTNNGLALGTVPAGTTLTLQTRVPGQINLINTTGQLITFWDGANSAVYNDGLIQGGTGIWNTLGGANSGWTDVSGYSNASFLNDSFAVFQGTPGTVTVSNVGGQVDASGMQFAVDGYVINGGPLKLIETASGSGSTTIRVGDGSAAGAGYTATINAVLEGSAQVVKTDDGTLILTAANTYTGGTAINGGTLQVADDGNLGDLSGGLSFNGGKLAASAGFTTTRATTLNANGGTIGVLNGSDTLTLTGAIDGVGRLTKTDDGTLVLTGANSYAGGTAFNGGVVQVANDGNLGAASGTLGFNGGTLATTGSFTANRATTLNAGGGTIDTAAGTTLIMGGAISGSGVLTKADSGTLVLGADNTYTGGTVISDGTLQVGNGGMTGTLGTGNVTDNGTLVFSRSNAYGYDGAISGTGRVAQNGTGTTTLSGVSTYTGGTTINAGKLVATNGSALGTGNVYNNAALQLDFATDSVLANRLVSGGSLTKTGSGTATLTGANSSEGAVSVNAGRLDFAQTGAFNATTLSTAGGATTSIDASATVVLSGALTQAAGATLDITVGTTPYRAISADTASINGALIVRDYSNVALPTSASGLANTQLTVLHTTNGITGDFATVDLNGAASTVDYLTLSRGVSSNGLDYNIGYTLKWFAGPVQGAGTFTLANASDTFNVDVMLTDQAASATGWDGRTLTKAGAGTLILSSANTYTGDTLVNDGTLQTGIDNAFAGSANVTLASGATLDLNGFSQTANNLSGAGNVTLGAGALTVNSGADTTLSGTVSGAGSLVKTGTGTFTLDGTNSYTGGTAISAGTLVATNGSALGTGTVANNAALTLDFATNQTFANQLAGSGTTRVTGAGIATVTGANSAYAGNWQIDGHAAVADIAASSTANLGMGAVNIASGGVLDANTTGAFAFNNALTGTGTLNASNGGNAFSFGAGVGTAFAGTVALTDNTFALSGNNTNALTSATLSLGAGNVTTVGAGQQNIGNLAMNGGTLSFDNLASNGTIATGNLTLTSGNVRIDPQSAGSTGNLLAQDEGMQRQLIAASGTVSGSAANLILQDLSGNALTSLTADVVQGGNVVAIGTYGYSLSTGTGNDGLYAGYMLTQLDLQDGQLTTLSGDTGTAAAELHAKLTGSGDLAIAATDTITLNNSANDYTGVTSVQSGTLKLGADHVLGATSQLSIANGATVDINGKTQSVDALNDVSGSVLNLNGGNLTVVLGGSSFGTLTGSGTLTIASGGAFSVHGANTDLSADVTVSANATVTLDDVAGLGNTGTLTDDGTILLFGSGTLAKNVAGTGAVNLAGSADVTLSGANTLSGSWNIVTGTKLTASEQANLGTAAIRNNGGTFDVNTATDWTLANAVTGSGTFVKDGSGTLTIAQANMMTGPVNIDGGVLSLTDADGAGSGLVTIASGAGLDLKLASAQTFDNQIAGSGSTSVTGALATITGANSGYTGNWTISGSAAVANTATSSTDNLGTGGVNIASGGVLNANTSGAFSFDNALTGAGTLNAANNDGAFSFGTNAGSAFAGTVALTDNTFALSGDNTTALTNATLSLGAGNVTTVGNGTQTIGGLAFNGGKAVFNATVPAETRATSYVEVSGAGHVLDLSGTGTVQVNLPTLGTPSLPATGNTNLLAQDDSGALTKLAGIASGATVTGTGGALTLTDAGGTDLTAADQSISILNAAGSAQAATGTYGYSLNTGSTNDGLYVAYRLKQVDILAGQTLTLAPDAGATGLATDLSAQVTGTGNLEIAAGAGNTVSLSNTLNSYSGMTDVTSGTLQLGVDHALGATSGLTVANGATVDINGKTQSVGSFTGQTGSTLNLNGGNLTITAGGTSVGSLTGSGALTLGGGTFAVTGANTGLTADVTIASGATATLDNVAGFGNTGTVIVDGALGLSGSGTLAKNVAGTGAVNLTGSANVALGGTNTLSGSWNIAAGTTLTASEQANLGTAAVNNAGTFDVNTATDWTLANAVTGSGTFVKDGSGTLTIAQANMMTGPVNINGGVLSLTDADGAGSGLVTIASGAGLDLKLASAQTFDNQIAGSGSTSVTGALATITGANSGYTGNWTISGSAAVANTATSSTDNLGTGGVNIASGGVLNANTSGAFSFDNALTGAGTLNASNGGAAFSFGTNAGSAFAGTVALTDNTFALSGNNTVALTNATLSLGAGNVTTVGTGNQNIGSLAFNGGTAIFDATIPAEKVADSTITISGNLDVSGTGTVQINLPSGSGWDNSQPLPDTQRSLLEQDDANVLVQLIRSNGTVTGTGGNLVLKDANGNTISNGQEVDIAQGGVKVAEGTYDYRLSTGAGNDGLYVNYGLTEVKLIGTGADALVLAPEAGASGTAADLSARVTGSGDLAIAAGAGNTVTLSNGGNDYSGATTVASGTLKLGADHALGMTSGLTIADGAVTDINGKTQGIGSFTGQTGSTLNLNGGNLTIADGGNSAGSLTGSGTLTIAGSTFAVTGANTGLTADVTIASGAAATLDDVAGLGNAGTVIIDGTLGLSGSGTLAKNVAGAGAVNLTGTADVTLGGTNTLSGSWNVAAGTKLTASEQANLGTATIIADGTFNAVANNDWAMTNLVTGAGTLLKTGTGLLKVGDDTLRSFAGLTDILAGTLQLGEYAGDDARIGGSVRIAEGAQLGGTGTIMGDVENTGTITSLNALGTYGSNGDASTLTITGILKNSGIVNLAGTKVGNTLTVGGIVGQGGTFVLNTVLGGDNSLTDRLIVNGGTVTGSSALRILNAGGTGAQTNTGILVVQAVNGATTDAGAFTLDPQSSGFRSTNRTLALGAYDYSLVRGGQGGNADSWYLTSVDTSAPKDNGGNGPRLLRPEAGIYGTNAAVASSMFLTTLHDREGYVQGNGIEQQYAGWGRVSGSRQDGRFGGNALGTKAGTTTAQLGVDLLRYSAPSFGTLYAGVMGGWGHSETSASSRQHTLAKATGNVDGYSAGVYGTWYQKDRGETGAYIDTWAQYSWFHNKVLGGGLPQEKYDSRAVTASIEAGYSILLMNNGKTKLFLEPQAQLAYVGYGMDRHIEQSGTVVRFKDGGGLVARVGARLSSHIHLENGATLRPFLEANYWHNQRGGKLRMNNDLVPSGAPRSFAEVKAGITADLSKNLQISAQVSYQTGTQHYRSLGGQVGLKYTW